MSNKVEIVKKILDKDENLWIEFKSYWYWDNDSNNTDIEKGWGEFLKDFVSLFNTYTDDSDIKYLIFGFDENNKKTQPFNIDKFGKKLKIFNSLRNFKKEIISKLKTFFIDIPMFSKDETLKYIPDLFDIYSLEIDGNNILVIEMYDAPYLLSLTKTLVANEGFKDGNIITRRLKTDNTPEVSNAFYNEIQLLEKKVIENKHKDFSENDVSIKKIVEAFKNKYFPAAEIVYIETIRERNGVYFEAFQLSAKWNEPINFLYLSKYSIQYKTLNYIEENKILKKEIKTIILTDRLNKDGGQIDLNKIYKQFSKYFINIKVNYIDYFALDELYFDMFDEDIFHNGNFNINDFIKPYTEQSNDKDALLLLKEWYENKFEPLIVIKGVGGIGKTTVVKYFLDDIYKTIKNKDVYVLFINSHEIINEIIKKGTIDNLFDFYDIVSKKCNIQEIVSKEIFELVIDNGHLILVLDGLDEVIAKLGSKFNVKQFIETIFLDYTNNLNKAKIIVTCRDYFWDKELEKRYTIKTLSLKPFDKSMAKEYFKKYNLNNKIEPMLKIADYFKTDDGGYIPYILDMIKDNYINNTDEKSIETEVLNLSIKNDILIAKACEREIKKLGNFSIDEQINFFINIAVKYNGEVREIHIKEICDKYNDSMIVNKFNAHPLLKFDENEKMLSFRYDFFNEYFKNVMLSIFFNSLNFKKIDKKTIQIINQHISFDGSLMKDLLLRLKIDDIEELKLNIIDLLENIHNVSDVSESDIRRLNSSLFVLLLSFGQYNDIESRTELLKDIYGNGKNYISNVSFVNFHILGKNKPLFDFRDLIIDNSYFENYEYFSECKFNENTFFKNSTFIAPLHRDKINTDMTIKNFEISSCNMEGIIYTLEEKENIYEANQKKIRHDLKQIIKFFWINSVFRQKTKEETHRKLSKYNRILKILIDHNVLIEVNISTRQKRNDIAYKLNVKYSNLRKIMEENESCPEFEEIVNLVN